MFIDDGLSSYASLMIVGIDSFLAGIPIGVLCNCYMPAGRPFNGFMDLFRCMDDIIDILDHPQAQFEQRHLVKKRVKQKREEIGREYSINPSVRPYWEPTQLKRVMSSKTRFYIHISLRQNASWQGWIEWPEGRCKVNFRSALELGKMMLEVLEQIDKRDGTQRAVNRRMRLRYKSSLGGKESPVDHHDGNAGARIEKTQTRETVTYMK